MFTFHRHWLRNASIAWATVSLSVALSAAPVVSVQVTPASVDVGNLFNAKVLVTGVSDLYAFEFDLAFTPTLVFALAVTEGDFFSRAGPSVFFAGAVDNAAGTFSFNAGSLLAAVSGASGDGVLAAFSFRADTAGLASFSLSNLTLLDSGLQSIASSTQGATVIVRDAGGQVPEPGSLLLALPFALLLLRPRRRSRAA